jgi:hypothetical protein
MVTSIRKVSLLAATATFATLLFAVVPSSAIAGDKDGADFANQRAAQIFFLKHGGPRHDPDRLDGDDDGVACEDNPCPCYRKKHLPRLAVDLTADRRLLLRS